MHSLIKNLILIGMGFLIAAGLGLYIFRNPSKTCNESLVAKRFRSNSLYQKEFEKIYYRQKTNQAYVMAGVFGGKGPKYDLEILEAKMFADGYSYADIITIRNLAENTMIKSL